MMFQRNNLLAQSLVLSAILGLFYGCTRIPRQAKTVSADLLAAQQFHKKNDELVYQKLQWCVERHLTNVREMKQTDLERLNLRFRSQIYERINNAYFDSIEKGFNALDVQTKTELEGITDQEQQNKIIALGAASKVKLVEDANERRAEQIERLLSLLEEEVNSAKVQLDQIEVDFRALQSKIEEPLRRIQEHQEQIIKSQEELNSYLHTKSEITYIISGFLQGIGVNVNDSQIEEGVNAASEKIEAKVNSVVDGLNTKLEGALGQAAVQLSGGGG